MAKHGAEHDGAGSNSGIAADELQQFVERVERLEEEKKALADDIKDVYSEIKGRGFDVAVMRRIIALRKQDASERAEFAAILELYCDALGIKNIFA